MVLVLGFSLKRSHTQHFTRTFMMHMIAVTKAIGQKSLQVVYIYIYIFKDFYDVYDSCYQSYRSKITTCGIYIR